MDTERRGTLFGVHPLGCPGAAAENRLIQRPCTPALSHPVGEGRESNDERSNGKGEKAVLRMPGVIAVPDSLPIGQAIAELILVIECSQPNELENLVIYLPLSRE